VGRQDAHGVVEAASMGTQEFAEFGVGVWSFAQRVEDIDRVALAGKRQEVLDGVEVVGHGRTSLSASTEGHCRSGG
jgi:hypothetical protein